jgi:hypothetical protein
LQAEAEAEASEEEEEPVAKAALKRQRTKSYDDIAHANFKDLSSVYDELRHERAHKLAIYWEELLSIEFKNMIGKWVR